MAISTGVRTHRAWLDIDGRVFPLLDASVEVHKTKKSSTFSGTVALKSKLGANLDEYWRDLGDHVAKVYCQSGMTPKCLLTGEVQKVHISFVHGTVRVSGQDKASKLHQKKSAEKFQNQKKSDVIKTLASRVGLDADVDEVPDFAGKRWYQDFAKITDGLTYAAVLHKLADMDGARWWTTGDGRIKYKVAAEDGPSPAGTYKLTYVGPTAATYAVGDCLDLNVDRNVVAGKKTKVKVHGWHQKKKKNHVGEAEVGGAGEGPTYTYHVPNIEPEQAQKHAKSRAKDIASHEIKLTAECVGDPDIDIEQDLELSGTAFAQTYEMESIHHSLGANRKSHTMRISAKSAKKGRKATATSRVEGPNVNSSADTDAEE